MCKMYFRMAVIGLQATQPLPYQEQQQLKTEQPSKGTWTVWATTGQHKEEQTNAAVSLVVYGLNGVSQPQALKLEEPEDEPVSGF